MSCVHPRHLYIDFYVLHKLLFWFFKHFTFPRISNTLANDKPTERDINMLFLLKNNPITEIIRLKIVNALTVLWNFTLSCWLTFFSAVAIGLIADKQIEDTTNIINANTTKSESIKNLINNSLINIEIVVITLHLISEFA